MQHKPAGHNRLALALPDFPSQLFPPATHQYTQQIRRFAPAAPRFFLDHLYPDKNAITLLLAGENETFLIAEGRAFLEPAKGFPGSSSSSDLTVHEALASSRTRSWLWTHVDSRQCRHDGIKLRPFEPAPETVPSLKPGRGSVCVCCCGRRHQSFSASSQTSLPLHVACLR